MIADSSPLVERDVRVFPLFVIVLLSVSACDDVRSSPAADVPSTHALIDLVIGTVEGPDEYVFGRITGLAADTVGNIYVSDVQASEIRMYDADGAFKRRVARSGSGPGEVQSPCCLAVGLDGRLWVRDGGNGRYNWYAISSSGAIETGTIRMAHGDAWYSMAPSFGSDGHLVDVGHRHEVDASAIVRFHRDAVGDVFQEELIRRPPRDSLAEHELTRETGVGAVTMVFHQPFGPFHLTAHSPRGGWAEAVSSRYSIRWHVSDSKPDVHIDREWEGPEVTAAERDAARNELEESLRRIGASFGNLPFGVPERKAPLRALQFDQAGRLWVHLTQPNAEAPRAHVYDSAGILLADIIWPERVSVVFLGDDMGLGIRSDSLGVNRVVRLRW